MFVLALQTGLNINQVFACFHQRRQLLACGIVGLARRLVERLGEPGDHLRVDRIVLRQSTGRQCEAANPLGIDDPHLDAGLAQRLGPVTLIAAGSLHDCLVHPVLAEPSHQLAVPLRGVQERLPQCEPANAGIHLVFGHIDADDNALILCHRPLPSLLGTGSRPLQLFGLRKTTGAVPRSVTSSVAFGALRAQFQRRAVVREPPVRTFWQIF
jgi:hypothetical protein